MATPPLLPAQRKVKLVTALKTTQSEQATKLQTKQQLETDLLEDIRSFTKLRAAAEKDYAQAILKATSQMLSKFQNKDEKKEEELRTPYGLWRRMLEETETMANARMTMSQTLQTSVADSIKTLKADRAVTLKKCSTLVEKLHEEIQVSAVELVKTQKSYTDFEKVTQQAREAAADAKEKKDKNAIGIFSSKSKLEKNLSKANERKEVSEKRSTIARNEYLLAIAAMNGHQQKYFSLDLPDLIAVQDGSIYEDFKNYFNIITSAERQACQICVDNIKILEENVAQVSTISEEFGAGLPLNKEARKWTLRVVREQKSIQRKTNELNTLRAGTQVDTASTTTENPSEEQKTTEQRIDLLTEAIRHHEVMLTKAESRVEALREAGVNVDEWLQGALTEVENEEENANKNENGEIEDNDFDEFAEEEWDEPSPRSNTMNYSDDAASIASSQDPRSLTTPAIAIYSFTATSQEELTIADGEELEFIEREGDGWCKTRNKAGQVGYVPEAYIEVRARRATTVSDDGTSRASSLTGSMNMIDEVTAPESAVSEIPIVEQAEQNLQNEVSDNADEISQADIICFAKAVYDYEACESEELNFKEGDVIMVISKMVDDDDGWWEGILDGQRGVFPSIVVEETQAPEGAQDYPVMKQRATTSDPYATFPRR